ncbi:MAG TPA: hypothetical protein VJ914_29895 [Pseudonocardiaceae bacterium]|nr:hypothetical protein [Pseudonocardiaceae bacterium]
MTEPENDPLQQRLREAQVAQAEAAARSAAIKADKDATDARTSQITALMPDLSKVKGSTLDVKDGPALFGTRLTYRALAKAAEKVAAKVTEKVSAAVPKDEDRAKLTVLVTTNADLASADANYLDVTTGLEQLNAAAEALLDPGWQVPPLFPDTETVSTRLNRSWMASFAFVAPAAVTAVAKALPSVLSLLSAQRSVITAAADTNDLAAAGVLAGALRTAKLKSTILLDDFRLLPKNSTVYKAAKDVADLREQLVAKKLELTDDAAGSASINTVILSIDQFTTAMRTVLQPGGRSPLAAAALYEQLHQDNGGISYVLLVNSQPGQLQQVTENRPMFLKDRFTTLADVDLLYVLIDTAESNVVAAGTETATAKASGEIGKDFTVTTT